MPFEARSRYVGADYVEQLAKVRGGTFRRNPPDVGILASLDSLDGPAFDAGRVHPLIREFYEHTRRPGSHQDDQALVGAVGLARRPDLHRR